MRGWGATILTVGWMAAASPTADARNLALVIGNDHYDHVQPLHTAVADANAVGDALQRLGFAVRRAIDADRSQTSRTFAEFEAALQPGDEAFVYYAGHGVEMGGTNYLVPTDVPDAQPNQPGVIRDASFPVPEIIDGLRERGARVTILVLDACRDNPFATAGSRTIGVAGGLARIDAPQGVFVLMSAGAKQEALDRLSPSDPDRDSVFTRVFLGQLGRPGRTLVEIAKATQVAVRDLAATAGYEQTPAYYDQVIGDVVLSAGAAETAVPTQPPVRTPVALPVAPVEKLQLGGRAPLASFMRSNSGWTVVASLPEPALELFYRLGSAGEFTSTGLSDTLDQRTGERSPNLSFPLPSGVEAATIMLRYTRIDGSSAGPFAIRFDATTALFNEQKRVLEQLSSDWVAFRPFNGSLLLYFTTLVTYRCAISNLRYGLNDGAPLTEYDLPSCNPDSPFEMPPSAKISMKVPADTRSIHLQITWRDGTQSEISTIRRN